MMDEFTREVAGRLAAVADRDEPPARLAAGILHDVRRRRSLNRIGIAMACVVALAGGTVATGALTRWWTAGGGHGRVRAASGPLAQFTGNAVGREYRLPPGAEVVALSAGGQALAVTRDGQTRTLWYVRPDGGQVRLDQAGADLAAWVTDGTVTAWTWKGAGARGWKCTDHPGQAPVSVSLPDPILFRVYADQGHLVWSDGRTHVTAGCGQPADRGPAGGVVFGVRWPYALTMKMADGSRVHGDNLAGGADVVYPFVVPLPGAAGVSMPIAVGPQGVLSFEARGPGYRWEFTGVPPGQAPRVIAHVPATPGDRDHEPSVGRSLLVIATIRPVARSVVYDPGTGRHAVVDGRVFVAGDLLLREKDGGYRLYTLVR